MRANRTPWSSPSWGRISLLLLAALARAQSFDVASVKRVTRTPGAKPKVEDNAHVEYRQEDVFNLLLRAYQMQAYQVSGPPWIKQNYYDIAAALPKNSTKADIPAMLQKLLAERFHLSVHRESRPTPVYIITVAAGGSRLQPCNMPDDPKPLTLEDRIGGIHTLPSGQCPPNRVFSRGESSLIIEANTLEFLTKGLHDGADRPVLDHTGLQGHFAIAFECEQLNGAHEDAVPLPTMPAALQKLGLKLEPGREPIEYLIVDGGNPVPTEN